MNINLLTTNAIKSTNTVEKAATTSQGLRVRTDLKAGIAVYERR